MDPVQVDSVAATVALPLAGHQAFVNERLDVGHGAAPADLALIGDVLIAREALAVIVGVVRHLNEDELPLRIAELLLEGFGHES